MADQKISELTEKTTSVGNDLLVIVDSEAVPIQTKKIKRSNLLGFDKSCRVYNSAVQSCANEAWTTLAFDSEAWDTDTIHDLVTNNSRLTCKTAGKYIITAFAAFAANATGQRFFTIKLNGTIYLTQACFQAAAAQRTACTIATLYSLAVNDYVEFLIYQNSGGALNTDIVDGTTNFSMARIA